MRASRDCRELHRGSPKSTHARAESFLEMKLSPGSGEVLGSAGCKNRPPSRLQKKAPASLQLDPAAGPGAAQPSPAAWGEGRTPIPLLSPLVSSAAPAWEADQGGSRTEPAHGGGAQAETSSGGDAGGILSPIRRGAHGGSNGERQEDETPSLAPSGGWRHPAMPTPTPASNVGGGWRHPAMSSPVPEPASLAPLFKSQCAVELPNAQPQAQAQR